MERVTRLPTPTSETTDAEVEELRRETALINARYAKLRAQQDLADLQRQMRFPNMNFWLIAVALFTTAVLLFDIIRG